MKNNMSKQHVYRLNSGLTTLPRSQPKI